MAARFWRCVLAVEFALAAAIGIYLGVDRHWPAGDTSLLILGVLALLQFLLIASSFILSPVLSAGRRDGAGWHRIPWTLLKEYVHFSVAQLRMCAEPYWHLHDVESPRAGQPARPLLLIHGIACNRAIWRPMIARLRAAGFAPVRTLDLEPLFPDIDSYTAGVERELLALHRCSSGSRVGIIAHSMGGLVARATLRSARPGLVDRVVTIATPHHGAAIARLFRAPAFLQMRPGSAWLNSLNATQAPSTVPFTCIYSLEDNLVAPARSGALAGAKLHELRGMGHLELLRAPQVAAHVVTALKQACPA